MSDKHLRRNIQILSQGCTQREILVYWLPFKLCYRCICSDINSLASPSEPSQLFQRLKVI
jgi:hypothetical protein